MIAKFSVKKPYTVLVGVILVIVLGVVSITRMVTDLLPDMSFPYVLVITTEIGATPEEVEKDVTAPVEAAMASTSNIKSISSVSNNSYSMVILEYEQSTNMDSTIIEIQQSIDLLKGSWNDDTIGSPLILQINPNMIPVMATAVSIEGMDHIELSRFVEDTLGPEIESVEGVASISTTGIVENRINVTLNDKKIEELNKQIETAIKKQFNEAQDKIDSGKSQIDSAQKEMQEGGNKLTDAYGEVNSKKEELYKTREDLTKQLSQLKSQKAALTEVKTGLEAFINSSEYQGLVSLQQAADAGVPGMKEQLDALNAGIKTQFSGLSAMGITVNTWQDLAPALSQVTATIVQIDTGITTIEAAFSQIDDGEVALNDALNTLNSNASLAAIQISLASGHLAVGSTELSNAQSTLDSAKEQALSQADLNNVLTIETLTGLLTAQNFSMPAGYVSDGNTQFMLRVGNTADSVEEFEGLVLIDMNMEDLAPIRLSDVADIEVKQENDNTYAVVNGEAGVLISMDKQTGYSTGEVTKNLLDTFDSLEIKHEGLHLDVLMDQGVYIDIIVAGVVKNIILGALLAVIVLLIFLRSLRPTLIIACSIPLSVLFAIVLMYFTGISLNIISMSGLALGIGMLVDNSIVVVENIFRMRQEGSSIEDASIMGTNQVVGAITASTLTTVSVYAPIVFTEGITRQLFVDMALTILYTLGASLIVAMTLVPAMAKGMLKKGTKENSGSYTAFLGGYERFLRWALSHKAIVFIAAIVLLITSMLGALSRGLNFLDMEIEADQISVSVSGPEDKDIEFDELTALADEVTSKLQGIEEIETIGAMAGGGSATSMMSGSDSVTMYIVLSEDRKRGINEIGDDIKERTSDVNGIVEVSTGSMDYTEFFGDGISINISGRDIDKLQELSKEVASIVEDVEGTVDVDDGLEDAVPEFRITVDREKAAKYGYTVAQMFQLVMGEIADSTSAATLTTDVEDYDIYLRTEDQSEVKLDDIKKLTFKYTDKEGEESDIAIADVCDFEETETLGSIRRSAQTRYLTVSAGIDDEHNVTLVASEIEDRIAKLDIPEGFTVKMSGEDETINDAMEQLLLMMLLAVIFIYLIMVSQFQSLRAPFIIMFTIPLAFTGGFIALLLTGVELNVIAMLGLIMLSGLIVNNGIVLVDYINKARENGIPKHEAIVESGKVRLRPILMTVLTTVLSMSTIALRIGKGSEMMQPMAITLIGGLIYGTLLTLIIIPCVYDIFHLKD